MPNIFKNYAKIYDIIYKDKDYSRESYFLEKIFRKYAARPVRDILDVACGTGRHAMCLAKQGFTVYAQDASGQMLALARRNARKARLPVKFVGCRPMHDFSSKIPFDVVIAMFSSIDYLVLRSELMKALDNVRRCLRPGGLFIFDFWNRDCVIREYSSLKTSMYEQGMRKVLRISETTLVQAKDIAKIQYTCYYFENGKRKAFVEELHQIKYYRIKDMEAIVEKCGFKVLSCFPFMKIGCKIKPADWNISLVVTPCAL